MTQTTFLFEGSELRNLSLSAPKGEQGASGGQTLTLHFAVACVLQETAPGQAAEEAYMQPLALVLEGAQLDGEVRDGIGALAEGVLRVGDERLSRLPLPWTQDAPFSLSLRFRNGTPWTLRARRGHCTPGPDARLLTSYAC
ncbi:hypothetical protein [Aquabacterium sp.]|jgi:hypothetical protein|uniref:hypothetical protein n=1 Tax=Aquabacterium sp. TaxID=1872578 RepID=UPI0025C0230B|nr:hypothetical protein [Aquabacterium sp.]